MSGHVTNHKTATSSQVLHTEHIGMEERACTDERREDSGAIRGGKFRTGPKDPVDVAYMDFSKAFDTVPHKRLIHKMRIMGIGENMSGYIWLLHMKPLIQHIKCVSIRFVSNCREILGSEELWPLLLASNVVPGILQLMVLPWVPESPRYLLIDLKDKDSCVAALRRLRGNRDFSSEVEEMMAEQTAIQGQKPKSLCELIWEPSLRRQLLTIVVLSSAMQLCGNDSMYFYASYVFQAAGISSERIQYIVIGTGSCELLTSITCTLVIDRVGRRVLVMGGYSLMSLWAVVFMVALSQQVQTFFYFFKQLVIMMNFSISIM
ncbi:unnamed protein product [Ranitomeya imitator]|uniref:Uncharacterized protein n=1 Tax=Ranitomeya imitator TaxID=111125 RepID=A0ABN9L5N4_9NEOB|nr:unnamed protein product [Ranitomeya imitator]